MTVTLEYYVKFGKGDYSETQEWEVELTKEQEAAYKKARMTEPDVRNYWNIPGLDAVLKKAYSEIEEMVLEDLIGEDGYEYAAECLGEVEVDADEINELVQARDPHAIEFFQLGNLSDEELEEWDANDLEELPLVKDFKEGFKPESPFDGGWRLLVKFPDELPGDEEIEDYLTEVLAAGDISLAKAVVKEQAFSYSGDIEEAALKIAEQVGCNEYIQQSTDTRGEG